jgi:hypothetical protein
MSQLGDLFPEYILKYGATGVMAVWLFTINSRLSDVEQRLYNCLETKAKIEHIFNSSSNSKESSQAYNKLPMYAILTDKTYLNQKKQKK